MHWTRTIEELLGKLRDTVPGEGMLGEVFYWRDLCRVLDGISQEIKQPQVELTIQILLTKASEDPKSLLKKEVEQFTKEKSRVMKGAKEARWNHKYMKIIEKPVKQIEAATNLGDIQVVIIALLKSLNNIYQNSNFYKEARIVSFVDRLLEKVKSKLQAKMGLQQSMLNGLKDHHAFSEDVYHSRSIVEKFTENFFILELLDTEKNKMKNFQGGQEEEEKKQTYDENSAEQ